MTSLIISICKIYVLNVVISLAFFIHILLVFMRNSNIGQLLNDMCGMRHNECANNIGKLKF